MISEIEYQVIIILTCINVVAVSGCFEISGSCGDEEDQFISAAYRPGRHGYIVEAAAVTHGGGSSIQNGYGR